MSKPNGLGTYIWLNFLIVHRDHKSIGMSPFKGLYGQECLTSLKWTNPLIQVQASKEMLDETETQTQLIQQDIIVAQDRQKSYADAKRLHQTFQEGDMVFLQVKLKRSSLRTGKCKKLNPHYCGPYLILKKINDQAYRLQLPNHIKVHNVFHVSLLKKYLSNPTHILDDSYLTSTEDATFEVFPQQILQTQSKPLRNCTITEHSSGQLTLL